MAEKLRHEDQGARVGPSVPCVVGQDLPQSGPEFTPALDRLQAELGKHGVSYEHWCAVKIGFVNEFLVTLFSEDVKTDVACRLETAICELAITRLPELLAEAGHGPALVHKTSKTSIDPYARRENTKESERTVAGRVPALEGLIAPLEAEIEKSLRWLEREAVTIDWAKQRPTGTGGLESVVLSSTAMHALLFVRKVLRDERDAVLRAHRQTQEEEKKEDHGSRVERQ